VKFTYLLFLLSLWITQIQAQQDLTCADFKEGHFVIPADELISFETQIVREGNQQTEVIELDGKVMEAVINIQWIDDCSYTLVFDQGDELAEKLKVDDLDKTRVYTTTILAINGNCASIKTNLDIDGEIIPHYGTMCKQELL